MANFYTSLRQIIAKPIQLLLTFGWRVIVSIVPHFTDIAYSLLSAKAIITMAILALAYGAGLLVTHFLGPEALEGCADWVYECTSEPLKCAACDYCEKEYASCAEIPIENGLLNSLFYITGLIPLLWT